ncbi:MAG: phenylalanine--tRNA ligase subunit alpha [Chloroflexi bacterium HGW-Chloroflexi-9]|nr:MAG: phenylalanine--tRNA ligase subunit alpha [Chloroflexi bacterium HGW-Chloroflexi-9]
MTTSPHDRVAEIEREGLEALAGTSDEAALDAWRVRVLGKSGTLTGVLRGLGELPPEDRKVLGAAANLAKNALEAALEERREALRRAALASVEADAIDVTLPGRPAPRGRLHPITQVRRQILDVFERLGFLVIEGPEVELDSYNFDSLRIPEHHPARDMWDTFWFDEEVDGKTPLLLRTHTSPMQVRFMETHEPPIRVAVPGRCYRYEATDATHEWMLEQVELLVIDEGVSMANLKGTLQEWARQMFGPSRKVMMRNSYFPFVEPGVEVAVDCFACPGDDPSCSVCRGSGWLELMGAGMVHRDIIEAQGYDPERYTGFAAGMGVERVAMVLLGVSDIRDFHLNDPRFLAQF